MRSDVGLAERTAAVRAAPSGLPGLMPGAVGGRTKLWLALGGVALLGGAHAYALRLPWDQASPWVLASHLFAVAMLAGLLWLGAALGLRVVRILGVGDAPGLEVLLFAVGLGLGGLAYLVLACGFLGLLRPWVLAALLAVLAIVLRAELAELMAALPTLGRAWLAQRRELRHDLMLRPTVMLAEVLVVLLVVRALAPPTGYDALHYHLEGPQQFLQLGRLAPLPELQQANMPFTVEMLYLLGLAFGSDELPNLVHLGLAVLLGLTTFSFGRRFFGPRVGWLAAATLLSAPTVAFYAPVANVDFGWAFFDFLAVYAFAIWTRGRRTHWLTIAGLAAGLSLGSKYLGLLTCAAVTLGIVVETARVRPIRPTQAARLLAHFVVPAALVAAPWYVKNWLWLGSPVWPFLASVQMAEIDAYFRQNMMGGRGLLGYLLLPRRLFGGDSEIPLAILPFLYALVPLYALVRKHRMVSYLLGLVALHLAVWSQVGPTIRYLAPIFPALGLAVAYVLHTGMTSLQSRRVVRIVAPILVILCMVFGGVAGGLKLYVERPFAQLVGLESRQAFLSRVLPDYDAVRYVNERRGEISRLLVIGDARLFYLEPPVLDEQGLGIADGLQLTGDPHDAVARLRRAGVSHVLIGFGHLSFLTQFDPEGRVLQWLRDFERVRPAYLTTEYTRDGVVRVYRVADAVSERSAP